MMIERMQFIYACNIKYINIQTQTDTHKENYKKKQKKWQQHQMRKQRVNIHENTPTSDYCG